MRPADSIKTHALRAALAVAVAFAVGTIATPAAEARPLPFGFNENYPFLLDGATLEEKVELTAAAGGTLAHTSLDWRCFEPARDVWDEECWSAHQAFYDQALAAGVTPLFSLIAAPEWAWAHPCRRRVSANCVMPPARSEDDEWREFAGAVAGRFPQAIFEVWNEPNQTSFWNGRPQPARYAELVRLAYRAVHRGSPTATVLAGAVVGTNQTTSKTFGSSKYLRSAFRSGKGLRRNMDGLSFHLYGLTQGLGRDDYFSKTTSRIRKLAQRYLAPERRNLWITETGTSTKPPERQSARRQKSLLWGVWRNLDRRRIFEGLVFHRLIQPKETSEVPWQYGAAWTRYRPLDDYPDPIKPKLVFCHFSNRLGTGYEPCQ